MARAGQARGQGAAAQAAPSWLPLSLAAQGFGSWSGWGLRLRRCVALEVEQRRVFPWLAVAFGCGILLFFAAEGRPALWAPLLGTGLAGAVATRLSARPVAFAATVGLAALFLGFAAGVIRLARVEAPILEKLTLGRVSGFIEAIEERGKGGRLLIRLHEIAAVPADKRPLKARLTVRELKGLKPGLFVTGTARLLPPPEPARPGGYDFARDAFFKRVGTVGSFTGAVEARPPPVEPDFGLRAAAAIDDARNGLTRRIADAIGGQAGAVAAALITGKRGLIDETTNEALRAAGIYHIVSISGLHMVLAAGVVFHIVRALLALSRTAALRWPCKKIAALAAMAGATAYCVFSGSDVAAERSLVMTLIMLGAILVGRPALSIRNLAFAALIVLALEPEALLGPSFQMSFGAVAALIAASHGASRYWRPLEGGGAAQRALRWLIVAAAGLIGTTLVASLATAPFGAFHFQTANPFGLVGNALALPLVSLIVMPCAVVGVLALPFGLDRPVWMLMGAAVEQVLRVSAWVGGFEGSTLVIPAFGTGALALFAAALITATLLVSPLRWIGLVPAALALWLAAHPERHDIFVARDGSSAAARGPDRRLVLVGNANAFQAEQWLRADGDRRASTDPSLKAPARCDLLGCVLATADGETLAVVADRRAFPEDCRRATIVVTRLTAPASCKAPLVIDRAYLARHGALAIRSTLTGRTILPARTGERRAWLRQPEPPAPRPRASADPSSPEEPAEPLSSDGSD